MFGFLKKKEKPEPDLPKIQITDTPAPTAVTEEKTGWWQRLSQGLQKSSANLGEGLKSVFTKKKLDDATLDALEELLIAADLGPAMAASLTQNLRKSRFGKDVSDEDVREFLAAEIATRLTPYEGQIDFESHKPFVLVMIGVNGAGKTTTLGKLAKQLSDSGKKVLLVAGDTFRAAAINQLQIWADRAACVLLSGDAGSDPASLVYKALEQAERESYDIVLIDTAGRLHNRDDLMAELQKIIRVIQKKDRAAPHATLLTLDATTGQNAIQQAEIFSHIVPVTGLVLTKLDGSAKGGVLLPLAEKTKIPVVAIGVGEALEDLQPFDAKSFAKALCG